MSAKELLCVVPFVVVHVYVCVSAVILCAWFGVPVRCVFGELARRFVDASPFVEVVVRR